MPSDPDHPQTGAPSSTVAPVLTFLHSDDPINFNMPLSVVFPSSAPEDVDMDQNTPNVSTSFQQGSSLITYVSAAQSSWYQSAKVKLSA